MQEYKHYKHWNFVAVLSYRKTRGTRAILLTWAKKAIQISITVSNLKYLDNFNQFSISCTKIWKIFQYLSIFLTGKYQAPFVGLVFVKRFFSKIFNLPSPPCLVASLFSRGIIIWSNLTLHSLCSYISFSFLNWILFQKIS